MEKKEEKKRVTIADPKEHKSVLDEPKRQPKVKNKIDLTDSEALKINGVRHYENQVF